MDNFELNVFLFLASFYLVVLPRRKKNKNMKKLLQKQPYGSPPTIESQFPPENAAIIHKV